MGLLAVALESFILKAVKSADLAELRAAADRLAKALSDVDEEEVVSEFKQMRRRGKAAAR
jgi:hypothetical protein